MELQERESRRNEIGIELHGPLPLQLCFLSHRHRPEHARGAGGLTVCIAELVVVVGIVRLERDRLLEGLRRLFRLAAGDRVQEVSCFDPATGVDACERRLTRVNGTVLAGTAYLRYYSPKEWEALARLAGLRLLRITSTCQSERNEPIDDDAPDLIALTEKLS